MSDKENSDSLKSKKQLDRRFYENQLQKFAARLKEIEEELKSLNIQAPKKDFWFAEKSRISQNLDDVKSEREKHFAEKKLVDADLKNVNLDIQTKHDSIGKLKSKLRYKTQERVDEVIAKLEKQLPRLKSKPAEQRRIEQEISELRDSKDKIIDYGRLEKEVQTLREKQKELRSTRDKNIQQITAIKQKEAATRTQFDEVKQDENEAWKTYKDSLSKRDQLRSEKDELKRNKRDLVERFKEQKQSKIRKEQERGILKQDNVEQATTNIRTKTITERKKPFEDEINSCDILLSFLDKYNAQYSSSQSESPKDQTERTQSIDSVDGKTSPPLNKDIYHGIKRRPSKRERRRKFHSSEVSKKIDLHVTVLEQLVSFQIQPPSTISDLAAATSQLRDKKKSFEEDQSRMVTLWEMRRAKSIPFLDQKTSMVVTDPLNEISKITPSDLQTRKKAMSLDLGKRHKSCPSLLSETLEQMHDVGSPCSSTTKDFGSNASDYDLESPVSGTSSASFLDRDSRSNSFADTHDVVLNRTEVHEDRSHVAVNRFMQGALSSKTDGGESKTDLDESKNYIAANKQIKSCLKPDSASDLVSKNDVEESEHGETLFEGPDIIESKTYPQSILNPFINANVEEEARLSKQLKPNSFVKTHTGTILKTTDEKENKVASIVSKLDRRKTNVEERKMSNDSASKSVAVVHADPLVQKSDASEIETSFIDDKLKRTEIDVEESKLSLLPQPHLPAHVGADLQVEKMDVEQTETSLIVDKPDETPIDIKRSKVFHHPKSNSFAGSHTDLITKITDTADDKTSTKMRSKSETDIEERKASTVDNKESKPHLKSNALALFKKKKMEADVKKRDSLANKNNKVEHKVRFSDAIIHADSDGQNNTLAQSESGSYQDSGNSELMKGVLHDVESGHTGEALSTKNEGNDSQYRNDETSGLDKDVESNNMLVEDKCHEKQIQESSPCLPDDQNDFKNEELNFEINHFGDGRKFHLQDGEGFVLHSDSSAEEDNFSKDFADEELKGLEIKVNGSKGKKINGKEFAKEFNSLPDTRDGVLCHLHDEKLDIELKNLGDAQGNDSKRELDHKEGLAGTLAISSDEPSRASNDLEVEKLNLEISDSWDSKDDLMKSERKDSVELDGNCQVLSDELIKDACSGGDVFDSVDSCSEDCRANFGAVSRNNSGDHRQSLENIEHVDNASQNDDLSEKLGQTQNGDAFLLFEIDDMKPSDRAKPLQCSADSGKLCGVGSNEAFLMRKCSSESSCSPRKSTHEYIPVDQGNDDGVQVTS